MTLGRRFAAGRRMRGFSTARTDIPVSIGGLAAWFDSRSDTYFAFGTGTQISTWVSRSGSLGAVTLSQATGGSQPVYSASVVSLNNMPAVQFDGTDDALGAASVADWTFLHNNTGVTIFTVERIDSTGIAVQYPYATCANAAANVGMFHSNASNALTMRVANGAGTFQNNFTSVVSALYARDVSRWRAWTYGGGVANAYVSGTSATQADTGGQTPSVTAPQSAFTVGRSPAGAGTSFKGYLPQILIYGRVLTTGELGSLAAVFAPIYGVTP